MTVDEIRELSLGNAVTEVHFVLQEARELKRQLAIELDIAREHRFASQKRFREFMDQLWQTLTDIRADFRIESTVLHLFREPEPGRGKQREIKRKEIIK